MACKSTEQISMEYGDLEVPIPPHFRELEHQPIVGEELLFFEFNYDERKKYGEKYKEILFWLVVVENIENNRIIFSRLWSFDYDSDDNVVESKTKGLFSAGIDCFRQPLKCCFCSSIYPANCYETGSPDLSVECPYVDEYRWTWFLPENGSPAEISICCYRTECKTQISWDDLKICPRRSRWDEYEGQFHVLVNWKNTWRPAAKLGPKKNMLLDTLEIIQCENYRYLSEFDDDHYPNRYYFDTMIDFLRIVLDWDFSLSPLIHNIPNFSLDESLKTIDFNPGLYCNVKGKSRNNDGILLKWQDTNRKWFDHKKLTSKLERWLECSRNRAKYFGFSYQALPSEFEVDKNGTVKLESFINGVFLSSNDSAVAKIEKTVERLIPLMENVGELSLKGEKIQLIIQSIGNRERGDFEWNCGNVYQEHVILSAMLFFDDCDLSIRQELSVDVVEQISTYHESKNGSYIKNTGFKLCNSILLGSKTVPKNECVIIKDTEHQVKLLGSKCEGICFMLVDPYDRIPSTADVPCQSGELMIICKTIFDRIPCELGRLILSFLGLNNGFSVEDAMGYEKNYYIQKRIYMNARNKCLSTEFGIPNDPFVD